MTLTLKNFKQAIPANILTRGRDYYQAGRVVDLELDGDDTWSAAIEGTEPYTVTIAQQPDGSLACECTCPYDLGEHCKHVAAALYAIEEVFPEYFDSKRRKPTAKRASRMDRLREAVRAAPPERLAATLLALAEGNREMQSQLLLLLGATDKPADVRALVKAAVRPPRGNYGFLDYYHATDAGRKVGEIVTRADRLLDAQPDQALVIYQIVLEETLAALEHSDDSAGVLSGNAYRAVDGVAKCAERLSPQDRAALFDYCLQEAVAPLVKGWGFNWQMLDLAAELVETPAQREALYAVLEPYEVAGKEENQDVISSARLAAEHAAEVKLTLITRLEGDAAALAFIADNSHLTSFRMMLIGRYLATGDLDADEELAEEGIRMVEGQRRPGIVADYRQLLLTLAQQRNDRPGIVKQARALWLSRGENEYYEIMAESVPPGEWVAFRTRLLSDDDCSPRLAAWAYAREELWSEVRNLVSAHPGLLPFYQLDMEKHFPDEMAKLYERLVRKMLKDVSNRQTYQDAAGYLVRMQKFGYGNEGRAIARALIEQYPQRRAMIEELKRAL
jgi:uncharacterized protein YbaA (DUF1428 family)